MIADQDHCRVNMSLARMDITTFSASLPTRTLDSGTVYPAHHQCEAEQATVKVHEATA